MGSKVIIIGAGASGMAAAIAAAREGADTIILEHKDRPGKKLLSTGNGKCNLTNLDCKPEDFRSDRPDFAWEVVEQTPPKAVMAFFEDLGLLLTNRNGYVYPASGQASSVLDALRFELDRLGIPTFYDCSVEDVSNDLTVTTACPAPTDNLVSAKAAAYMVSPSGSKGRWKAAAVVLATGSKAAAVTGSDGSGYRLASRLGHRIIKPLPALVQLRCGERWHKGVSGVRTEASVALYVNGERMAADRGELLFTDYGISGIPVFQVSRYAACALDSGKKVRVSLDLLPTMEPGELSDLLKKRRERLGCRPFEEFLNGVLNKKLCRLILKEANIPLDGDSQKLTDVMLHRIVEHVKGLGASVIATNPFEQAQVCRGGVDTEEVSPETMESKLVRGLYFSGEILDVDGICGGYNLQWAWASGILAGKSAGRKGQTISEVNAKRRNRTESEEGAGRKDQTEPVVNARKKARTAASYKNERVSSDNAKKKGKNRAERGKR